jgi:hypothetical protein
MADISLIISDQNVVVTPFGSELVSPLVAAAATSASTATTKAAEAAASATAAATSADTTYVELEYVQAASWETANKYFLRPVRNVSLTGTLAQYRFRWVAPFDNVGGSYNVHIVKYGVTPASDGTITAGQSVTGNSGVTTGDGGLINIFSANGTSQIVVGEVTQYGVLSAVRNPDPVGANPGIASRWHLIEPADKITPNIARWVWSTSDWGFTPSVDRPIMYTKMSADAHFFDMIPDNTLGYSGSVAKRHSDTFRLVQSNAASYNSISGFTMAINSFFSKYQGRSCEDMNMQIGGISRGFTADTGRGPTTLEPPIEGGKFGDAGSLYVLSGYHHGSYGSPTAVLKSYLNEPSTSTITGATKANPLVLTLQSIGLAIHQYNVGDVIIPRGVTGMTQINDVELTVTAISTTTVTIGAVNSSAYGTFTGHPSGGIDYVTTLDPEGAVVGYTHHTTAMVETDTILNKNAAGNVFCKTTYVKTFDPRLANQIRIQTTHAFNDAAVTVAPGFRRAFGMLFAGTDLNRCQAVLNGVAQSIQTIDLRDGSGTTLGFPEKVYFWHSDFPQKQIVVTNNYGYGYTHKENGTLVSNATASASYVSNFDWGIKLYAGLYGDHGAGTTLRNMTGIVCTTDVSIGFLFADART